MLDGIFVFDNAIHCYDMSDENLREDARDARYSRDLLLAMGAGGRWAGYNDGSIEFKRRWTVEELYAMVFEDAPTDLAMVQVVPIFDWFKDTFAPVLTQHEMAKRYPDRVLFCGGVDPLWQGVDAALEQLDWQVKELGACSIKFYNGHVDRWWACDDRELAYPLYERCLELGITTIQFHKGIPFGLMDLEAMKPNDLQRPARDFPELNFVIHHLALPYFEEAVWIAARFPNIYLSLASNLNFTLIAPRVVQMQLGQLLQMVGSEKLCYASDAALSGGPAPYLQAFMDLEIPDDLRDGYGFPQITRRDRENILGLTFARLMGIDVEAKKAELAAAPA
ncbi:MAG TPA: amidohydrolase family protein [Gaiellaceae bacterium]|nr:amidohydrolase family protein [Gaiellaceae bacterium]